MQIDHPQLWTDYLVDRLRDYCFLYESDRGCQFDIYEKEFYMRIEDEQDDEQQPKRDMHITYSCHVFDRALQGIPFYLRLSTEANCYKESNIGYLEIANDHNIYEELQAKIRVCIRQDLKLESRLDKAVSDASFPPGFGKVITLRLHEDYKDKLVTADAVGIKFPILELEIEYSQGQAEEKWTTK